MAVPIARDLRRVHRPASWTSSNASTVDVPFDGLHWFFDHAETISARNLERVKALGGGIAIQHRMAYQGEYFVDRYGAEAAERTPPVRRDASNVACPSAPEPTRRAWRATTRGWRSTGS